MCAQKKSENLRAVVNLIRVDNEVCVVGLTDSMRWEWEKEDGASGADARTMVWVTLTKRNDGGVIREEIGLFCSRDDPCRKLILCSLSRLMDIVWNVIDEDLNDTDAREKWFGYRLED